MKMDKLHKITPKVSAQVGNLFECDPIELKSATFLNYPEIYSKIPNVPVKPYTVILNISPSKENISLKLPIPTNKAFITIIYVI